MQLWLVTVPNGKESPDTIVETLRLNVSNAKFHRFQIPNLVVGTLDSLISLSDDLSKINAHVENVVKKVERQYLDISGSVAKTLRVNSSTVEAYLRKFDWDFARYQHSGRPLSELVSQIQTASTKVDEELKKLSLNYSEKNIQLAALQRKKQTNLLTSDFEDFLTPEFVARMDVLQADDEKLLETVMIACSKSLEQEFIRSYETIGKDIVSYADSKGTPIVPGSHKKVFEDLENVMYSIVILKHHYIAGKFDGDNYLSGTKSDFLEPLKSAFREKKFTLREFSYDGNKPSGIDGQIDFAKQQLEQTVSSLVRWCEIHYGEVYSGWVHLKVIRGFVESVLRYGLPVNFVSVFVEPSAQKEKQVKVSLLHAITQLRPDLSHSKVELEDEEQDSEDTDHLPFVCQKFTVIGASEK